MTGWEAASGRLAGGAEYYGGTLGWKVFPCYGIVGGRCECGTVHPEPKDAGKHPYGRIVSEGQLEATDDVSVIQEWWRQAPEANIGVVCEASGLIVIDVDPRNGGLDSWVTLDEMTEGAMGATVEALTGEYMTRTGPERGRHLFFRVGEGESLLGKIKGVPGIDIKHKGYVLINPSRHASGMCYDWREGHAPWEREVAEAPDELMALIRKRPPRKGGGGGAGGGSEERYGSFDWDGQRFDMDAMLADGIYQGERVNSLYPMACHLSNQYPVKTGHGAASVRAIMRGINAEYVHPPLDARELEFQVERAIEFVRENPKETAAGRMLEPALVEWAAERREETAAEIVTDRLAGVGLPSDPDAADEADGGLVGRRSMTDLGNGRRIVDYAGAGVRYTAGVGWHVWNQEYWVPDTNEGMIHEIAKRLPVWIGSELAELEEGDSRADDLVKWAHKARSLACRRAAVADARSDVRIQVPVSRWDGNAHMLGVKNGVINLETGDLMENRPELHITKQSRVAYTPGMRNVRWEEFIDFATGGDKELQRYLQMAAGYTLTGDRHHECMFLIYGPPGSGKSTFLEVVGTLLGDYYIPMDSDVLVENVGGAAARSSTEYHLAQLMGRRMIGISEWPEGRGTKEDTIKRLTGDTMITARHPSERPFQFESQAKLWVGTNVKPRISERAMWRRIRAINFSHVPERPDPDLKGYLLDPEGALPAVLSWAVEGAVKLIGSRERMPLGIGACAAVRDATRAYEESEDRFGMFMAEELKEMSGGSVPVKQVYTVYKRWVEERGEREPKMWTVTRILEEKGMKLTGTGNVVMLHDWVLKPRVVPSGEVGAWAGLVEGSRSV